MPEVFVQTRIIYLHYFHFQSDINGTVAFTDFSVNILLQCIHALQFLAFKMKVRINRVTAHVTLTRQRIFKYYQVIKIRESSGRSPYKQKKHRTWNQSKVIAHAEFVIKPSTKLFNSTGANLVFRSQTILPTVPSFRKFFFFSLSSKEWNLAPCASAFSCRSWLTQF
jgi:hypothetical protein